MAGLGLIRGGARVAFQSRGWEKGVTQAVQRLVGRHILSQPQKGWHANSREFASLVSDDVLGGLTRVHEDPTVGRCLLAEEDIPANTVALPVDGVVLAAPNTWTIQVSATQHILSVGGSQLVAHSCKPNLQLLFDYSNDRKYDGAKEGEKLPTLWFTTTRAVKRGERLSFDYNTSEWVVTDVFTDEHTGRRIEGFGKVQDPQYRLRLLPYITPPIREIALERGLLTEEEAAIAGAYSSTL
eukprot:Hpha_TRINITY_DN16008_c2_g1::TRINITY_DN16008_c2_g1_i1::g.120510::m.120510